MKSFSFTALILAAMLPIGACGSGNGAKTYGEPVFGTVKDAEPVVSTTLGKVSGENRDGIAIFRGIPYGGPCEGEGRFKEPSPAQSWEGVRKCTENAPVAVQFGEGSISGNRNPLGDYFNGGDRSKFGVDNEKKGENCLALNVLTPGIDKGKRPVIFYTHGGGFASGSGTLVLGADKLAREEDVVIVGINHRLSVFGFLYLGDLDPEYAFSGNAGMLDIIQALQWVHDNIANFGGDPGNVTIMGESGGGAKVNLLLGMDKAKGLFSKAIIESGMGMVNNYSTAQAAEQRDILLERLGLDRKNWKEILTMPADSILKASAGLKMSPVGDNLNVIYSDSDEYAFRDIAKDIPLMIGSSADEMGVFQPVDKLAAEITEENLPDYVAKAMPTLSREKVDTLVADYRKANVRGDEPWHLYLRIVSTSTSLGNGSYYGAMAKASQQGAPVYAYFIEYDSKLPSNPQYRLAWHTADLPLQMRVVLYPDTEELSKTMGHAWAAFARTGSPSTDRLQWEPFTTAGKETMVFDTENKMVSNPMKAIIDASEKIK